MCSTVLVFVFQASYTAVCELVCGMAAHFHRVLLDLSRGLLKALHSNILMPMCD